MRKWPETATAVAVAIQPGNRLALLAPYGVTDLVAMIVRPTSPDMVELVKARMEKKRWLKLYPNLELALEEDAG